MIEIDNLTVRYSKKGPLVLKGIDFAVEQGKIAVLLGPNGAGKSTLLKAILGILKPQEGAVIVDGEPVLKMKSSLRAQTIAYVPQSIDFAPLTVKESVLLGRLPHFGINPTRDDLAKVDEVLREFALEQLADRNVAELSGGEKQKVAIARAFAQEPKLMVFDEPSSNLDIKNELALFSLVRKLSKDKGIAVVMAIHDINRALTLGERFLLLKEGCKILSGGVEELSEEALENTFDVAVKFQEINGKKIAQFEEKP